MLGCRVRLSRQRRRKGPIGDMSPTDTPPSVYPVAVCEAAGGRHHFSEPASACNRVDRGVILRTANAIYALSG